VKLKTQKKELVSWKTGCSKSTVKGEKRSKTNEESFQELCDNIKRENI
jgi:hypothetical protein